MPEPDLTSRAPSQVGDSRRTRTWAIIAASAVIVAALLPIRRYPDQWEWPFEYPDHFASLQILWVFLRPIVGIAALIFALALGRARPLALVAAVGAYLLVELLAWPEAYPYGPTSVPQPLDILRRVAVTGAMLGIALSIFAPMLRRGPLIGAINASVVLFLVLLPGEPWSLMESLLKGEAWVDSREGQLRLLLLVGFCIFMQAGYFPSVVADATERGVARGHWFRMTAMFLAICGAAASPFLRLMTANEDLGFLAYAIVRWTLFEYGALALLGIGVFGLLTRGVAAAAASTDSAAPRSTPTGTDLPETFGRPWGIAAGCGLFASFLLPIVVPTGRNQVEAIWSWDLIRASEGGAALGFLLHPLAGIVTVILACTLATRGRVISCLAIGGTLILVGLIVSSEQFSTVPAVRGAGELTTFTTLLVLGLAVTFIGTTIVRAAPHRRIGSLMAAIAASVVLLLMLLPIIPMSDVPLIRILFEEDLWREAWSIGLMFLYMIGYCGFCLAGYAPWRTPINFGRIGYGLGMVMLIALPGSISMVGIGERDALTGMLFTFSIKYLSAAYATLLLLGIGFAGLVLGTGSRTGKAITGQISSPHEGADHLRERLGSLDRLRADGVLSEEEYTAKRRQIIDSADI